MTSANKSVEKAEIKKSKKPGQPVNPFKVIGRFLARIPGSVFRTAKNGLWDADVYRRWFAALIWGLVLFAAAWVVSYFLLKPQTMSGTLLSMKLFGHNGSTALVTLKNFAQQFLTVFVFILLLNHFRIGKLNGGHYFFLVYAILMGVMVGTNSYQFHYHFINKYQALLPFVLYGIWEMIAYALILAATTKLAWFETPGLIRGDWTKVRSFREIRMTNEEKEVLIYGFLILAVSSFGEARQLVGRLN